MEHTKTPWTYGGEGFAYIEDANSGFVICSMKHPKGDFWKNYKANARRIVAAVNACEGIGTEWLEKHKLEFTGKAIDKIHILKAQNARMLAALREIQSEIEIPENPKLALTAIIKEIIDSALSEAESQPETL